MGRARTKSRKAQAAGAAAATTATGTTTHRSEPKAPSTSALLEKAQALIIQCDYELAERFVRRILEKEPAHAAAREMLGVVQLETGDLFQAQQARLSSTIQPYSCSYILIII